MRSELGMESKNFWAKMNILWVSIGILRFSIIGL